MKTCPVLPDARLSTKSCRYTNFKGKKLKYSANVITYDQVLTRFENVQIVAGASLYIQTPFNSVFMTDDIRKFEFLGMGEIVGLVNQSLVVKNDSSYWIYCNGIKVSLFFYMDGDRICYTHIKNDAYPELLTTCIIYQNFLVIACDQNALFIDFQASSDVQCKFAGPITKFYSVEFRGIDFLVFEYVKHSSIHQALFYHNELLSSDVKIVINGTTVSIYYSAPGYTEARGRSRSYVLPSDAPIEFLNPELIGAKDACHAPQDAMQVLRNRAEFVMPRLIRHAFALSDMKNRVMFLKAVFRGESFDVVSPVFNVLMHSSRTIASLIHTQYAERFSLLLADESLFYELPDLRALKEMPKYKFKSKLTEREAVFLSRTYRRVFNYDAEVKETRNLAYRIIKKEKEYLETLNVEALFNDTAKYSAELVKMVNGYYRDTRIEEVLNILLENFILIQPDLADVTNSRQGIFLLRCSCNLGPFIANYKQWYYRSIYRPPFKVNSLPVDDRLQKEILFLNAANLFSYYKRPELLNVCEQLGQAFGDGLINGLSREDLEHYLKLAASADDSNLRFIFLVISTYPVQFDLGKNQTINTLLRSGMESSNLEVKKAAMCALAIYNLGSHDRNVLATLEEEVDKFGPVKAERNTAFYNIEYRKMAAVCLASIASRPLMPGFNDSFCELLTCGLSSVGSGLSLGMLRRTDDCRPEEIFYSVLLQLTSDFSTTPEELIDSIDQLGPLNEVSRMYKAAAKIFYVSLYHVHTGTSPNAIVYRRIFNLGLYLEDFILSNKDIQFLFNFALVALSIMKAGTCDIEMCRILRRLVLKTREVKFMKECSLFDYKKKDMVGFRGYDFESMQLYKICLGLVCLNFGMSKLKRTAAKQLIVTFFVSKATLLMFNFMDVLRMLIVKFVEDDPEVIEGMKLTAKNLDFAWRRKKCMRLFKKKFGACSDVDKKFVIDILSDYYENYHFTENGASLFDLSVLAKLLSITK